MSNKILGLVIALIIIIGAAIAGYFYWQQTRPLKVSTQNPSLIPPPDMDRQAPQAPAQQPAQATSTPAASPVTRNNTECKRDFSQAELNENASINIQNREVAVDVQNFGTITLGFYPSDAPKAVENFLRLANAGYYDCLTFHRVAAGFVIQGGDPNGNGSGGTSAYGAPFADELNPVTQSYKTGYVAGVLAMANSGPNTNGSQFFITTANDTQALQHLYTIFGHVISGMDVAEKIGALQTNPPGDGMPLTPVIMTSVKIIK